MVSMAQKCIPNKSPCDQNLSENQLPLATYQIIVLSSTILNAIDSVQAPTKQNATNETGNYYACTSVDKFSFEMLGFCD